VLALLLAILPGLAAGAIQTEGSHAAGDVITLSGTTNLAAGDTLQIEVTSASFRPAEKTERAGFAGASGTVTVVHGTPRNTWSFTFDSSGFRPDEYLVTVESVETGLRESSTFILAERGPLATGTVPLTPGETVTTLPAGTPIPPSPSATPKAGSPPVLLALPVLFFLFLRPHS
jgi:hypothetical protein